MNVFKRFWKGIVLRGESADPADNIEGSLWSNSTNNRFRGYIEGNVHEVITADQVQTLTNKTINAANNTITGIVLPATDITYDNTGRINITATDVQGAIDEIDTLAGVLDTTPSNYTPVGNPDVIADHLKGIDSALATAGQVEYSDSDFRVYDNADNTKKIALEASAIATATTRTISMPNADVNLAKVNTSIQADGSVVFTADQSLNSHKLTNVTDPTNPQDAATKAYVDSVSGSGANTALSNLTATAINQDLVPNTDETRSIGTIGNWWGIIKSATVDTKALRIMPTGSQTTPAGILFGASTTPGGNSVQFSIKNNTLTDNIGLYSATNGSGATGNVVINTGNATGGNSGSIILTAGTSSGGSKGDVQISANSALYLADTNINYVNQNLSLVTGSNQTISNSGYNFSLTNSSLTSISGISASGGRQIVLINQTGNTISIVNEESGTTAANRIQTGTGANISLMDHAALALIYDTSESRWVVLGGTGGSSGPTQNTDTIANNQTSASNITGLSFNSANVTSARVFYQIIRTSSSAELVETGSFMVSYKAVANNWTLGAEDFMNDDSGVVFSITSGGQVQYTSSNVAGTSYAGNIKFKIQDTLT